VQTRSVQSPWRACTVRGPSVCWSACALYLQLDACRLSDLNMASYVCATVCRGKDMDIDMDMDMDLGKHWRWANLGAGCFGPELPPLQPRRRSCASERAKTAGGVPEPRGSQ